MKKSGRFVFGVVLALGLAGVVSAKKVEGVKLDETKTLAGQTLTLNGAGLRTATVLKVRLYVASFYATQKIQTEADVLAAQGPLRFDFVFLRAFPKNKVEDAWRWQFKQSGTKTYDGYENDVEAFATAFGPIAKGGVETVELEGDETRIYDDGVLRGSVKGRDFQKAFLGLWFGTKPVMPSLKAALLGKEGKH